MHAAMHAAMHRLLFLLAALGFLAASLSWLAGARRAYHRARAVEHRGLHAQAAQWRSIGAKDALAGALFVSLVPGLVAAAIQHQTSTAEVFLVVGAVPALLSLVWIRRFIRLAGLIEAEADYGQRQRERADQEADLTSRVAARLGADNLATPGGILLRTLYHPVEGLVGGDFLGTASSGEDVLFVIGDVSGHGLDAAIQALRLKDLLLAAALAGSPTRWRWPTPTCAPTRPGRHWPPCSWPATTSPPSRRLLGYPQEPTQRQARRVRNSYWVPDRK